MLCNQDGGGGEGMGVEQLHLLPCPLSQSTVVLPFLCQAMMFNHSCKSLNSGASSCDKRIMYKNSVFFSQEMKFP